MPPRTFFKKVGAEEMKSAALFGPRARGSLRLKAVESNALRPLPVYAKTKSMSLTPSYTTLPIKFLVKTKW